MTFLQTVCRANFSSRHVIYLIMPGWCNMWRPHLPNRPQHLLKHYLAYDALICIQDMHMSGVYTSVLKCCFGCGKFWYQL